jgi:hypothetical protein
MRPMTYNEELERWEVHMDGWFDDLRCGECLRIQIGGKGIPCRLELDQDWYVIMEEARFNLRKKDLYQVEI